MIWDGIVNLMLHKGWMPLKYKQKRKNRREEEKMKTYYVSNEFEIKIQNIQIVFTRIYCHFIFTTVSMSILINLDKHEKS